MIFGRKVDGEYVETQMPEGGEEPPVDECPDGSRIESIREPHENGAEITFLTADVESKDERMTQWITAEDWDVLNLEGWR